MQTLVVGIDAACFPVVDSLDDGDVPTLTELVAVGASAELASQIPPWTPSAWPSIYTGTNPGKHGVFDFVTFDGYDWRIVNRSDVRERPLWQLLDERGLTSVVVNAPVTYPTRPFDGALIPGYMAPEDPTCHPEGTLADVRDAVGAYRVYPSHTDDPGAGAADARAEYRRLVGMRGDAFRYLADEYDPDFGFVQFQVTDTLFHEFPGDGETVAAVYDAVDDELARLREACDPETLFVVSDHGMGPYDGYECRVNELLRSAGYVETTRGGGMPSWSAVRDDALVAGDEETEPTVSAVERVGRALAAIGLTASRIERVLERAGLAAVARRHAPSGVVHGASERVDFAASTAYLRSRIECGVRLNVAGRDPDGTVDPDEYGAVRSAVISLLESARTPDGEPVFEEVAPREAYFEGPAAEEGVDIVTVPRAFDQFLSAQLGDGAFGEPSEPWNHKRDGLVVATGDAVDEAVSLADPHVFDVAPTVLASLDVPATERMDGRALPVVEDAGEVAYRSETDESAAIEDDAAIEDRLSALGYIE